MPIDPTIPLQAKMPQIPNMLEQAQGIMALQVQKAKLDEFKRNMKMESSVRDIFARYPDPEDLGKAKMDILRTVGPSGLKYVDAIAQSNEMFDKADVAQLQKMKEVTGFIRDTATEAAMLPVEKRMPFLQQRAMMARQFNLPEEFYSSINMLADDEAVQMAARSAEVLDNETQRRLDELNIEKTGYDVDKAKFELEQTKAGKKDSRSLNEELADLYTVVNPSGDESRRIRAIENALGYVANQYGSGWKLLSTPEGAPLWYQPSTGKTEYAPEGTRPQYAAGEREEISLLDEMLEQSSELKELANNNRDAIGFGQGWYQEKKNIITGTTNDKSKMFRISNNLKDILLRARSGAQINEQEYARLSKLMPSVNTSEVKFFSDLNAFMEETDRIIKRRTGLSPLISGDKSKTDQKEEENGSVSPSGPQTGDIQEYNGDTYKFNGKEWVKQ